MCNIKNGKELEQDSILGKQEVRQHIKTIGSEILVPLFKANRVIDKPIQKVDIYYVMPDFHYYRRLDFLKLLDCNPFVYYYKAMSTQYFNSVQNIPRAVFRAWRYRRLYFSIKKYGIHFENNDVWSVPWLFASKECIIRLDGSHRASIARYLDYKTIKVLVLTPKDILSLQDIPESYRTFLNSLGEPEINLQDSSSLKI